MRPKATGRWGIEGVVPRDRWRDRWHQNRREMDGAGAERRKLAPDKVGELCGRPASIQNPCRLYAGNQLAREIVMLYSETKYSLCVCVCEMKQNIRLTLFRFFWVLAATEMSRSVHRKLDSCAK